MNNLKYLKLPFLALLLLGLGACEEDLSEIGELNTPTNLTLNVDVAQDGSGKVTVDANADDAFVYHLFFGVGESETATVSSTGSVEYIYRNSGDYIIRVVAYGSGGLSSNTSTDISVEVLYEPPTDLIQTLTNGTSRNWLWRKAVPGHLGVGPTADDNGNPVGEPIWYMAQPFEKEADGCLYEDLMTFTLNSDNTVDYSLNNNGVTYFNRGEVAAELGETPPGADQCYNYEVAPIVAVGFFESESGLSNTTDVSFLLGSGSFISYFLGSSTYEILSYSNDEIDLRVIQTDDTGFQFAWYIKLIAEDAAVDPEPEFELFWSEEFDGDGAPDPATWSYNIGVGDNGWGNGEEQFYTDRLDNVSVSDGTLKITAKRENFSGRQYTSGRIITQDKFEFTYGKIEIRAKLPTGGGTWPALWLLGANFDVVGWPSCGEMDIMEHVGNRQDVVQAAVHSPSSFGDTFNKGETTVPGVSDGFNTYELIWDAQSLRFGVNGNTYYTYDPPVKDGQTWPFNSDAFFILNVAMGGSLGGAIDNAFTESTMEVDYIRVFKEQ
ncbi:MAG: glycoside hydrolase family 16 protein [Bacteroidota bacterium]